jgi:hypothetical protein
MFHYTIRRLLFAIPTLLVISFIIFALLDLSPGDPTANLPLTIPAEVREQIKVSLGLGEPFHVRYLKWLAQFFVNEPLNLLEDMTGWTIGDGERLRVISWQTRSPVVDLILERLPQTLWVVGLAYLIGILIAVPIGVISAYRQYSWFDQIGTLVSMIGFSVPTFFMGLAMIVIFSVKLQWLPSIYDTNLRVTDLHTFWLQVKQMLMPVTVLARLDARQPQPGLCADGAGEGPARAGGGADPRAQELAHSGGHGDRARGADDLRGGDHHRADLPRERPRAAPHHRHPGSGPAARADAHLHVRGADRGLQPDRRCALRHPRPANPL